MILVSKFGMIAAQFLCAAKQTNWNQTQNVGLRNAVNMFDEAQEHNGWEPTFSCTKKTDGHLRMTIWKK